MTPQEKNVFGKLFSKTELASHKVELALLDNIESDVLANGKAKDSARQLIRDAFSNIAKAADLYTNIEKRQQNIKSNSDKFKTTIKELGLQVTDQFQKNIIADLYVDKNIGNSIKSLQSASSSLKVTGEV
jgi:hypothetical protein